MTTKDAVLGAAIDRLEGDAAAGPRHSDGRAPEVSPIAVGWHVWRYRLDGADGDALGARPEGVVVDVGLDANQHPIVVVVRWRARQRRMEAWCETWPLSDVDPESAVALSTSRQVSAAKQLCSVIGEGMKSGHWRDTEEALLMAAVRLTRGRWVA